MQLAAKYVTRVAEVEINPNVANVENAADTRRTKGAAVVYYRKPLATKDMGYARLSRRVKNMVNSVLFQDVTIGRFQKLGPIISNPMFLLF